jgi:hypothetical protein
MDGFHRAGRFRGLGGKHRFQDGVIYAGVFQVDERLGGSVEFGAAGLNIFHNESGFKSLCRHVDDIRVGKWFLRLCEGCRGYGDAYGRGTPGDREVSLRLLLRIEPSVSVA